MSQFDLLFSQYKITSRQKYLHIQNPQFISKNLMYNTCMWMQFENSPKLAFSSRWSKPLSVFHNNSCIRPEETSGNLFPLVQLYGCPDRVVRVENQRSITGSPLIYARVGTQSLNKVELTTSATRSTTSGLFAPNHRAGPPLRTLYCYPLTASSMSIIEQLAINLQRCK